MADYLPQTMLPLSNLIKGLKYIHDLDNESKYHICDDILIIKTILKPDDFPLEIFNTLGELGFVCENFDGGWVVYG